MERAIIALWIVMAIVSITITGVAIWAIVELVGWITNGGLTAFIHGS